MAAADEDPEEARNSGIRYDLVRPVQVLSHSILDVGSDTSYQSNLARWEWRTFSESFLVACPKHGENPQVFYYQVVHETDSDRIALRLVFYEGFVIDVLLGEPEHDPGPSTQHWKCLASIHAEL